MINKLKIIVLILTFPGVTAANNIYFNIGNNHSSVPFKRFSKLIYSNFHPVYELGKTFDLKEKPNWTWFQTVNVGYFKHRFVQSAIMIYSENGINKKIVNGTSANVKLGAGYMHAFTAPEIVQQNAAGDYEIKSDYGRPQILLSLSFGIEQSIIKNVSNGPKISLSYQIRVQTPYVQSYVPLLPYNVLKFGLIFPLHDKKL